MEAVATLEALTSGQFDGHLQEPIKRLKMAEGLTQFPREIFKFSQSLEILDLSNNQLDRLPDDFGRLKKLKILFMSYNNFDHVPAVLADCPALEMIGMKANGIKTVAEHALPDTTRWLILTDNNIERLPHSMGKLTQLRKLALSGNRLQSLPDSMANCQALELVRLSANQLTVLPDWLLSLPKLSWLAFAGNPLCDVSKRAGHAESGHAESSHEERKAMVELSLKDIELGEQIGEGASGLIYKARFYKARCSVDDLSDGDEDVAVKLFKGAITSDGYPADEVSTCLQAGEHPNLIKSLATIRAQSHDGQDQLGLVMTLIPPHFDNLGLPPSLATCTRDTFEQGTAFELETIKDIVSSMADVMAQLHERQVSHGDVYAHNIMVSKEDACGRMPLLFGDFGAASDVSCLSVSQRLGMEAIEVRALGCLLEDLLIHACVPEAAAETWLSDQLQGLQQSCMAEDLSMRPSFSGIKQTLQTLNSKGI